MRPEVLEDVVRVDKPTGSNIGIGLAQRFVQGRTIGLIEPVARVKRQQFQLGALG